MLVAIVSENCAGFLVTNFCVDSPQEKGLTLSPKDHSWSEKAVLGATLGIPGHERSNSRNGTHGLIYVKTLFSEQLLERLSELVGRQNFSPNSRSFFFKNWGGPPAPETHKEIKTIFWKRELTEFCKKKTG